MKVCIPSLLLLLMGAAAAAAEEKSFIRLRQLDEESPCATPIENVTIGPYFVPSYLSACFRTLEVNSTLMTQHIEAMRQTFQDYFCFYDLANDAANSDPLSYQPELGYTLFEGANEGQVNLEEELTSLLETIETEGASIGTFWDIQTIFNKLRDAHVYPFPIAGSVGELLYTVLYVIPGRQFDPETTMGVHSWEPSYDDEGMLQLKVSFQSADGTEIEEDMIASIDGKTPFEWYFDLISNPQIGGWQYQSVGARMNGAFNTIKPPAPGGLFAFAFEGWSLPPDALPDSFPVVYASGKEEIYVTGVSLFSYAERFSYNATDIHEFVNSDPVFEDPGPAFLNFAIALFQVLNATSSQVQEMAPPELERKVVPEPKARAGHEESKEDYSFDEAITVAAVPPLVGPQVVGAWKITDDYAVLKLNSFFFFQGVNDDGNPVPDFWSNFTQAAKARGVKKAIIDITANGGGSVQSCNALAISMYPYVPFELFDDLYDINYNDAMLAYNSSITPLLGFVNTTIDNTTDQELQEYLETLPENLGDLLEAVSTSLLQFCCGDANITTCVESNPRCKIYAEKVEEEIYTLNEFPNGPQLRRVLKGIINSLSFFDPFAVLAFGNIDPNEINTVVRGGVELNLTNKFAGQGLLSENEYYEFAARSFQNDWMFDEYTLVGDGTGGSATMLFASTLMQLWNNRETMWNGRDVQPAPLTTITFGGTLEPQDTTIAGFPASVQPGQVGYPIIASGMLYMLEFLLPAEASEVISASNEYFSSFLATPPYFAANVPSMPVYNFYSAFMESDAFPLQYVKMFSDRHHHIPQIYTGVSLTDTTDLEELYSMSAKLGFSTSEKPPVVEESEDEAEGLVATSRDGW